MPCGSGKKPGKRNGWRRKQPGPVYLDTKRFLWRLLQIVCWKGCILSLTPETHGNGYGMGAADAIMCRLFEQLDLDMIHPNSITSTSLGFSKIPKIMPSDRAAIQLCLRTCNRIDPKNPRIIRIKNTLALTEFEISEAMLPELKENMQVLTAPYPLPFDNQGNLL